MRLKGIPMISHERGKTEYDYDKRNLYFVICYTDIPSNF
jgi:hypothetical protein